MNVHILVYLKTLLVSHNVLYRANFEQFVDRDAEGSVYDVTDVLRLRYSEWLKKITTNVNKG